MGHQVFTVGQVPPGGHLMVLVTANKDGSFHNLCAPFLAPYLCTVLCLTRLNKAYYGLKGWDTEWNNNEMGAANMDPTWLTGKRCGRI